MLFICNSEGTPGVPTTVSMLEQGAAGLDAIEAGIRLVESDPSIRSVGYNSWPNLLGELELDAAIMNGVSLRTGAVGALKGFAHPISVARAVMNQLPHELLVGQGAERFAGEIGAERADNVTDDARAAWQKVIDTYATPATKADWPNTPMAELASVASDPEIGRDTTIYLTLDAADEVMAGASTSGWAWKYPGRLGDSPIIGAGCYADNAYGAAACTGTGEMSIRAGTARSVVLYMKMGMNVEEAVYEAAADLRRLDAGLQFSNQIHAIDRDGQHKVVVAYHPRMQARADDPQRQWHYWHWQSGMAQAQRCTAELFRL